MSISLCMIAKDEENFIGTALASIKNFVDEIIVVDTGSIDKTKEIAKSFGAIVKESVWQKDFSYHRNEAISLATCDWILFLDCDEVLQLENQYFAKQFLEECNYSKKAFNLKIVNIINNKEIASFKALRLFKNHENFIFSNPIHEQIILSISNKYPYNFIDDLPLTIFHYGYNEDIIKSKDKRNRNLEILNKIENKDGYFYAMLGDEYLQSNNLEEAKKNYELSFNNTNISMNDYSPTLILNYLTTLINLKSYNEAIKILNYSQNKLPNFSDLYFLEFWIYYFKSEYKLALYKLDKYITLLNFPNEDTFSVKNFSTLYNLNDIRKSCINNLYKISN